MNDELAITLENFTKKFNYRQLTSFFLSPVITFELLANLSFSNNQSNVFKNWKWGEFLKLINTAIQEMIKIPDFSKKILKKF